MSRMDLSPALVLLAAVLAFVPAYGAAEEPPTPEAQEAAPAPEATPEPAPAVAALPTAPDLSPPLRPLRSTLTYERWALMSRQERLTFVDGAVLALTDLTLRLKQSFTNDGRIPPDTLGAIVQIIDEFYPKLPSAEYLREMERIYLTAEGRNLAMMDCFQQAFRRMNRR
jgi:hypothetical protein